jgi:hypothetical protein
MDDGDPFLVLVVTNPYNNRFDDDDDKDDEEEKKEEEWAAVTDNDIETAIGHV